MAIQQSPNKACTLAEIYQFIMDLFPYFRQVSECQESSILYNVFINQIVEKQASK